MTTSITPGQRKQIIRLMEDGLDALELDKNSAQRLLIERGGDLQAKLKEVLRELLVSRYADEEVRSSYGYPRGYRAKGITEQTNRLRELFPDIGYADEEMASKPLPDGAEGWFAIPRWNKIAETYEEAVKKVLALIKQTHKGKFYNYCVGMLGPQYLRQHANAAKMLQTLGKQQRNHDILIVPAQFGLRHRGRSVRRAHEVMKASEFGLGVFMVGIMLLTHPERLAHHDDLWIDCAGDKFSPFAVGRFGGTPSFSFGLGGVRFGALSSGDAVALRGSVSAFLLQ